MNFFAGEFDLPWWGWISGAVVGGLMCLLFWSAAVESRRRRWFHSAMAFLAVAALFPLFSLTGSAKRTSSPEEMSVGEDHKLRKAS